MRVVALGNFDGVHLGHQAIVSLAAATAGDDGRVTAVAFEPLPATVLRPGQAPLRLTAEPRRTELLLRAGCTDVQHLDPASGVLQQEPRAFIAALRARIPFDAIVEGADFRFGSRRAGTVETLRQIGAELGFQTVVAPEFHTALSDGHDVPPRSTTIRWLLQLGRVQDAAALLGRAHQVIGMVRRGAQRGRALGFPTANVECAGQQLPADGVYAGSVQTPHGDFPAAISVGTNPTFGGSLRTCEAHILGFRSPPGEYDWPISVLFARWLRDQAAFASVDALMDQMKRDVAQCA